MKHAPRRNHPDNGAQAQGLVHASVLGILDAFILSAVGAGCLLCLRLFVGHADFADLQ